MKVDEWIIIVEDMSGGNVGVLPAYDTPSPTDEAPVATSSSVSVSSSGATVTGVVASTTTSAREFPTTPAKKFVNDRELSGTFFFWKLSNLNCS